MIAKLKLLCVSVVSLIFLRIYECSQKYKHQPDDFFNDDENNVVFSYYVEKAIVFSECMIILMLCLIVYDLEKRGKNREMCL